ncbi:TIGR02301 family protein [Polycladidibacter stylochi]|uniref:TIGR02301 family protein n=1 Tax=Polycladidibacter stylochi TaxID=1807766 RepID=UPI000832E85E|nr:TIGR02301 family protein [Pseudovibrio stylochi]
MAIFFTVNLASSAPVQENSEAKPATQTQAPENNSPVEPPELKNSPYEPQLMRLAEIMGALHYLRPLCGYKAEADEWRGRMQALLDMEVKNELRRRRLVERFNQSYRGYASVYSQCTDSAKAATKRYIREGYETSHLILGKYSRK